MQKQFTDSTQPITFRNKCLDLLTDITPKKGIKFEQLVALVLPRIEVLEVEDAWRWIDVPLDVKSQIFPHDDGQDTGIDILARRFDRSYIALQLKCYQTDRVLKQGDISSFLAKTGGRSEIARRMIVATCGFSRNISKGYADCTLIHAQTDPDWANVPISAGMSVHKPKELDTLQRRALRNVVTGLEIHDRGQLIMACGTGKTLVSQRVSELIVPSGGTVLYATPSIGLTAQSRREWIANSKTPIRTVVVCSDVTAGKGGDQTGRVDEIESPVSTDPITIARAVKKARLSLPNGQGIVSIFSTYQSMDRIVESQQLAEDPLPEFDLAIADEAHRTTGGRSKNNAASKAMDGAGIFQLIHDKVSARKRLYQTATPRIYSRRISRKTINQIVQWEQSDVEVIDMSNEQFYGPELERISFSEALEVENEKERRLCDYRVIIATVSDDYGVLATEMAQVVKNTSMSIRLVSLALAIQGMKAKSGGGGGGGTPDISSCIAFCNTLAKARGATKILGSQELNDWAYDRAQAARPDLSSKKSVTVGYLDGTSPVQDRRLELDKLREAKQAGTKHITTNVKVLSEGIDVPALDAICFLEERKSEVDIVQAVGRVMRRPPNGEKEFGYIIVPVRMSPQLNFENTLSMWDQDWSVLGQVLRALKAHDPRIETNLHERIIIIDPPPEPPGPGGETGPMGFFDQLRAGKFDSWAPALMEFSGIQPTTQETTNLIKNAVADATQHLAAETGLGKRLMQIAGVADKKDKPERRACSACALYLTNALLMHQRLYDTRDKAESKDGMISISSLEEVQKKKKPEQILARDWRRVLNVDYAAIFRPAIETIEAASIKGEGIEGLRIALRMLSRHCAEIAERYVQQGMDHAGELFQAAMDNPDSDGAYYTLTPGAMLLAELACDALADPDDQRWSSLEYWQQNTVLDPACGSGTLLTAFATAVRRRAEAQGASKSDLDTLQQVLVEDSLTGMDINRQALQIAASQLAIGTSGRNLTRMGLYAMDRNNPNGEARLGSLERLTTHRDGTTLAQSDMLFHGTKDVNAAKGENVDVAESGTPNRLGERLACTAVAISNPPFSNSAKEGGALVRDLQLQNKKRKLLLKKTLVADDSALDGVLNPNSISPWFTALMDKLVDQQDGVLAKVLPTTALTGIGGAAERRFLANRFHIQAIVTLHHPRDLNWSVDTRITESLLIARRRSSDCESKPTRFIALLRRPVGVEESLQLHSTIRSGKIHAWGRECTWPIDRMMEGDWSPTVWTQSKLAEAGRQIEEFAHQLDWIRLGQQFNVTTTKEIVGKEKWTWCEENELGEMPVARFTGMDAQTRINGRIDQYANRAEKYHNNESVFSNLDSKKSHLLITNSQRSDTGRLTAIVMTDRAVGMGWTPVIGVSVSEAKALAVYLNSTLGRIGMRRYGARTLSWPMYQPAAIEQFIVPNLCNLGGQNRMSILCNAYDSTWKNEVPMYRDGYSEIRRCWDDAVAKACEIDRHWIGQLAELLHDEPIVTGKAPPLQS